jgi:predicted phosphoribosyltransferase
MRFLDRQDAGRRLGERVAGLGLDDPVVLALPRGGVPVACEVARALGAPFDVIVARKVGAPGRPELGIGAVAEGDFVVGVPDAPEETWEELQRRVQLYRDGRPLPDLAGRDVVVVDDGLATGVTAAAALLSVRSHGPRRLVLAVPVGVPETVARLDAEVVCLAAPRNFVAVGQWYDDFSQTTDEEVLAFLRPARSATRTPRPFA